MNSPTEFLAVATDARTGMPRYFDKSDLHQDDYSVLKASSAISFVCHSYKVCGIPYYDGTLGDMVPIEKVFACGCDKVVLILIKPKNIFRTLGEDMKFAERI